MSRLTTIFLAALALLGTISCGSYTSGEHELLVSFVPQDDALLVLEIERGIESSPDDASIRQAVEALRSAADGRRRYPAAGGLFSVDLDSAEAPDTIDPARRAEFREIASSVRVEQSGLYLDERGRLSFYRLTRFDHCARLLEIVNAFVCREGGGPEADAAPFSSAFPFFDEASWKLARDAYDAQHRWIAIEGDSIVLDVPMTEANAARCLGHLLAEARTSPESEISQLFAQISGFEVSGGHARIRVLGPERRVMRFTGGNGDASYDHAVERSFVDQAFKLGGPDAPARARAQLESAGSPRAK